MEDPVRKVLYETRLHASRPYTPNYPPQQASDGVKDSFFPFSPPQVMIKLKEKLRDYRYKQPRKLRRLISLYISPRGEHVAVATGNHLTFFRKTDDYHEPSGSFTNPVLTTFSIGTWSENHDVLGVVDDTETVYFIKPNGEEIARITGRELKVPSPIMGLIAWEDFDTQRSSLCSFIIVTSEGPLQLMEIGRDPSISMLSVCISNKELSMKCQFPSRIFCCDFHPDLSVLVIIGSSVDFSPNSSRDPGPCHLSLWRISKNLALEPLFSLQFGGFYIKPNGHRGQLSYRKLQISPLAQFVATLDATGCLFIFKLDKKNFTVSKVYFSGKDSTNVENCCPIEEDFLNDVWDFTWWSDHVLIIAKRCGIVIMIDILSGRKLQEDGPRYLLPILERAKHVPGHLFLLGSSVYKEKLDSSRDTDYDNCDDFNLIAEDTHNHCDISRVKWHLETFSEKSVLEMYNILISGKKYQEALEFADCYGLDKDEVLKSQWLNSEQGIEEIDTFLADVKDKVFVLSECVNKVGLTENAMKALLSHGLQITDQCEFSDSEDDDEKNWNFRIARLQILQFRDKLETYLGINMGRYSMEEYRKFRIVPMHEVALTLAQSGKIGALNLLFKRHPYSLYSIMLEVLTAIPETIPVQTYGQLLPGKSPPTTIAVREKDWVECAKLIRFISQSSDKSEIGVQMKTEPILKQCVGLRWPSTDELVLWYTNRARDIDTFTGQLDNCLDLLDFAIRKGISELQQFYEDVLYLHQLVYSEDFGEEGFRINVVEWQQLSDYEKFRMMVKGVKEGNVIKRLFEKAMPFMQKRSRCIPSIAPNSVADSKTCLDSDTTESFLVRWMKEIASENKLDICLIILDEVCRNIESYDLFTNEVEAIGCGLQCIYLCPATDRWSVMASILTKLPQIPDTEVSEDLEKRLKLAEGHIDAGRLLSFYQVPKPLNFFLEAHADGKGVKQIFRLILSKFSRRQPVRSDSDWANMWRDMQYLRDKAFPFLDLEYMLFEFCRGLLKAGKFSLARNYLRGTSSISLASDKAENLVIQAAKEYFFAAPSLSCPEIWKAKECLNLFPSRNTRAELDIIDVITINLPSLGVIILPMQFRQIKDPLEVVKKAISCQPGAYLHVDELIEIAKLLGLNSLDEISAVEEAIAREAAVAGDLQLAFDLCLVLAKKGHGSIWDLCAAIARGPGLENMNITSRKQLLGFALSHCDEESIPELLYAWKDLDMQGQCEKLMHLTGRSSSKFSFQSSFHSTQNIVDKKHLYTFQDNCGEVQEIEMEKLRVSIYEVAKNLPVENKTSLESFFDENGKVVVFAASQLPWLIELSVKTENEEKLIPGNKYASVRTQSIVTILSWLARNGFVPTDRFIASLAQSIIEPPVTKEDDLTGGFLLLNLMDAFNGVEIIEEQIRARVNYSEVSSITNVGMTYCSLHSSGVECESPAERRKLLMRKFRGKHLSPSSDESVNLGEVQSSFWRQWKAKLEEQKRVADHSRAFENILPGVETARILSGDSNYISSVVHSLMESIMLEKKHIIKDILQLADTYGLERIEVLLKYVTSILISEVWSNDDIMVELAELRHELINCAAETIKAISMSVYSAIDGYNKLRLSYVYGLLYDCYSELEKTGESMAHHSEFLVTNVGFSHFFEVVGQECKKVAFIKHLNYKNVVGLGDLNFECFSQEVYANVDENNLEALAKMVESLLSLYVEPLPEGLISWQDVYKFFVFNSLTTLETRFGTDINVKSPEDLKDLVSQLEHSIDSCRVYIKFLTCSDAVHALKRYFTIIIPLYSSYAEVPDNAEWQDCLITLLHFWIRLTFELKEVMYHGKARENLMCTPDCLTSCLEVFIRLVKEDSISPSQGWATTVNYAKNGLIGDLSLEALIFCKAMVLSACGFGAVEEVFSETVPRLSTPTSSTEMEVQDLPHLYLKVFETILDELLCSAHEHHNLHHLLSSLSKLEGDLEELRKVRQLVWERMAEFSDNLQIASSIRVYVLELMQFIADKSIKGFSAEIQYNVQSWEGWDAFQCGSKESETVGAGPVLSDHKDASSRLTSTLVSLKSSRLVSMISPSLEVASDDLLTVDTTFACFLRLCGAATNDFHVDILLDILAEWEGLFVMERNEVSSAETSAENDWNNDGWDEGWESFQEIKSTEKEKMETITSIHPLHLCWAEIFKILISLSRFTNLLSLIDQSLTKQNGILLDEDDTRCLTHVLMDKDCFVCLKMLLLLPYEALRFECLDSVEAKLKQEGISGALNGDVQLLILLLSSGVISTIVTNPSYDSVFSYLCHLMGKFSHQFQAMQLSKLSRRQSYEPQNKAFDSLHLFRKVVFPCFIAELVKADQHVLAAYIVTKLMSTNSSFSLINIAEASLCRYLERELQALEDDNDEFWKTEISTKKTLENSVFKLRGMLRSFIESALRLL